MRNAKQAASSAERKILHPPTPTSHPSTTATTYPVIQQWPAKDCQTIFQKDELTHLHYVFFRWFMEDLLEKTRFAFKGLFRFFFPFSFTPQPKILFVVISCNPGPSSISCFCLTRNFPNSFQPGYFFSLCCKSCCH